MFNAYFLQLASGRLTRLPYFLYSLLLAVVVATLELGIEMLALGPDAVLYEDATILQLTPVTAGQWSLFVLAFALKLTYLFCALNLTAKRARDIGLPGWYVAVGFLVLGGLLSLIVSTALATATVSILGIILVFIPTDMFARGKTA